jgi:hypothetical protein
MKRLLMIAAALLALTSAAQASDRFALECGLIQVAPPDNDRDPIIKIGVNVFWSPANARNPTGFTVEHYSVGGKVYSREDQYRDYRMWSTKTSENWSGVSIRNPALTMIGTIFEERGRTYYVERIFNRGRLETVVKSTCRGISPEEPTVAAPTVENLPRWLKP